jgi:hypothetical protein
VTEFTIVSRKYPSKFRSHCKKCSVEVINKYIKDNPERAKQSFKRWREDNAQHRKEQAAKWYKKDPEAAKGRRLRKYWPGSTWQEALANYNKMHTDQNGLCLFCGQKETTKDRHGGIKSLAVDHDHTTGKARGLLCYNCNSAFGSIKENIKAIQNMLDYAIKHSNPEPKVPQTEERNG